MAEPDGPNASCLVRRHRSVYQLPSDQPAPAGVQRRLDHLARHRLPELAARRLATLGAADDGSVWLVRRLDLELAVDLAAFTDDAVATAWAGRLTADLRRLLAAGPDGANVLRFDSRESFLAAFLHDLARDQAWGRWYYRDLDGLRQLGASRAITTALLRAPQRLTGVFACLEQRGQLSTVLGRLQETDAQTLLDVVAPDTTTVRPGRAQVEAVVQAWCHTEQPLRHSRSTAALLLLVRVIVSRGDATSPPGLRLAVETVLGLAATVQTPASRRAVLTAVAEGRALPRHLLQQAGSNAAALVSLLSRLEPGDAAWLEQVLQVVTPARPAQTHAGAEVTSLRSEFAGVFLLLPSFLSLQLDQVLGGCGELRRQVLARCFGGERFAAADADPVLALAAGAEHGDDPGGHRAADAGLLLDRLVAAGQATTRLLVAELVPHHAGLFLLLRDAETGAWLWAGPSPAAGWSQTLATALHAAAAAAGEPAELVLLSDQLADAVSPTAMPHQPTRLLWSPPPGRAPVAGLVPVSGAAGLWATEATPLAPKKSEILTRFLHHARPAAQELAYLQPSAPEVIIPLPLLVATQAVLGHFARRLPGFEWSGGRFLYDSFLAGMGTVQVTADRLLVTLPASPLRLVTRITGVDGTSFRLPWLGRRVELALPAG